MLVELRRELDEVARHAAERGVAHVREHRVQRVPELVEERRHVVEGDQGRLARGAGFVKFSDVEDDRLGSEQTALVDEAVLPGAAALVRS